MSITTILHAVGGVKHMVVDSPIGPLTVVRDDEGVTGVYFPRHWTRPDQTTWGPEVDAATCPGFDAVSRQLGEYFAGTRQTFDLPLHVDADEATSHVWELIDGISYGETTTYGALAREVGGGIDARTVGWMVGHNPLSIIVPCHRVVGANGTLVGYAGGVARKRWLLEHEGGLPAALW